MVDGEPTAYWWREFGEVLWGRIDGAEKMPLIHLAPFDKRKAYVGGFGGIRNKHTRVVVEFTTNSALSPELLDRDQLSS